MKFKVNRFRSNHRVLWLVLIPSMLFLLAGIILCIWLAGIFSPVETRAPEAFPDNEIVFVATGRKVGFVNADGSDPQYVKIVAKAYGDTSTVWPWRPVMTGDNRSLIVKMSDHVGAIAKPRLLVLWHTGAFPVLCTKWGEQQTVSLSTDQSYIFIRTEQGLALYRLDSCGTEDSPVKVYDNILGIPSSDLHYVAYTNPTNVLPNDDRFIVIHDITSGMERTVGPGDYPAWSRDGQWLAYTGKDGIYVVNVAEGAEPRRVILYPNLYDQNDRTYTARGYWEIPPEASWSPDGRWLVYHKWTGTNPMVAPDPYDNAIYKLNIETGQEIKIIDHGMYPYWRWPTETP
jgi:hypothetical protein